MGKKRVPKLSIREVEELENGYKNDNNASYLCVVVI
jgi:hypothetical protein